MHSALAGNVRNGNENATGVSPAVTALVVCVGFAATSWAWTLLVLPQAVLAARSGQGILWQVKLVAVPLALTAVGRVVVGVFTDRYGARVLLPVICVTAAVPLAAVSTVELVPAQVMLTCAAAIAGAMFPAGVAAVVRACPPRRRGLTLATCGSGSLAGVIAATLTWQWVLHGGWRLPMLAALLLFGLAALVPVLVRDRYQGTVEPVTRHAIRKMLGIPSTSRLALLYAVAFGALRAIMLYLPVYLHAEYNLDWTRAALLTVGCLMVAAVTRPVGGWLADRNRGGPTLVTCFAVTGACVLLQALQPPLPWGGLALGVAALCLGMASGTVLALIGVRAPVGRVGAVAGAVSAVGVAASLVPPALMFVTYALDGSFAVALVVMSALLVATASGVRRWRGLFVCARSRWRW